MNFLVSSMLLALQMCVETVGCVVHDQECAADVANFHFVLLSEDWVDIVVLGGSYNQRVNTLDLSLKTQDIVCGINMKS